MKINKELSAVLENVLQDVLFFRDNDSVQLGILGGLYDEGGLDDEDIQSDTGLKAWIDFLRSNNIVAEGDDTKRDRLSIAKEMRKFFPNVSDKYIAYHDYKNKLEDIRRAALSNYMQGARDEIPYIFNSSTAGESTEDVMNAYLENRPDGIQPLYNHPKYYPHDFFNAIASSLEGAIDYYQEMQDETDDEQEKRRYKRLANDAQYLLGAYNIDSRDDVTRHMRHLTPMMYKNLLKSGNPLKAITEVYAYLEDNESRFDPEHTNFNSVNQLQKTIEKFREVDKRRANVTKVYDYIRRNKDRLGWNFVRNYNPAQSINVVPFIRGERGKGLEDIHDDDPYFLDILGRLEAEENAPYEISDEVKAAPKVTSDDWELIDSPENQKAIGKLCAHCYGDTETYGDSYFEDYKNRIRNGDVLLFHLKGTQITGEIDIETDNNGRIIKAYVGQIQDYHNRSPEKKAYLKESLKILAERLIGVNLRPIAKEQIEKDLSDIIAKHMLKPASNHVLSAITRRFI